MREMRKREEENMDQSGHGRDTKRKILKWVTTGMKMFKNKIEFEITRKVKKEIERWSEGLETE